MTKSKKSLVAGAALAGLLAGTAVTVQASNLLSSAKGNTFSSQDSGDKKVKEKHACKGQNSCKGKGGCKGQ